MKCHSGIPPVDHLSKALIINPLAPPDHEMDIVGTSLGLAGSVLHLVVFSIEFVSDVKQVYQKGATDSNVDLAIVASSIQSATKSLEAQLEESGGQQGTEESKLDPDEQVSDFHVGLMVHTLRNVKIGVSCAQI